MQVHTRVAERTCYALGVPEDPRNNFMNHRKPLLVVAALASTAALSAAHAEIIFNIYNSDSDYKYAAYDALGAVTNPKTRPTPLS